jgi:hypothetical protein
MLFAMDSLTWRRTWPDAHFDFVAERGGRVEMRVYRHADGRRWQWFDQLTGMQGIEESREAALLLAKNRAVLGG